MNDKQILYQLTKDVVAYRTFQFGGVGINRKHCLQEKRSEFILKLIKDEDIQRIRRNGFQSKRWKSNWSGDTLLVHNIPIEQKPLCPVCKNKISYLPESSMHEHSPNCRLRVYYD